MCDSIRTLRFKRAAVKRKISTALTRVEGETSNQIVESCALNLESLLEDIDEYNKQINDCFSGDVQDDTLPPDFLKELDSQSYYDIDVKAQILKLKSSKPEAVVGQKSSVKIKLPEIIAPCFPEKIFLN